MTLNAALGKYWKEHGQHLPSAWSAVDLHSRHLLNHFGTSIHLDEIDDAQVNDYKTACMGEEVSNATVNRRLGQLRSVMRRASKEWGVETSAMDIGKHMLLEPEARTRWLTPEEADRLIAKAAEHLKAPIRFALLTGARLSNIVGLQWQDVNMHKRIIRFCGVKSHLPGGKTLEVTMSENAFALLVKQKPQKSGHVFLRHFKPNRQTGQQRKPEPIRKFRRSFATACKNAGITDFRFHDLRHTAASWMVQEGVPLDMVQKVLGHSDISMTQKYAHRETSAMVQAMEALATAQMRHTEKMEEECKARKTA